MDRNKLLNIIQKDLSELSDINQEMNRNGQLSEIEIELALNKARLIFREYEFLQEIWRNEGSTTATPVATEPIVRQADSPKEEPIKMPSPVGIQEKPNVERETEKPQLFIEPIIISEIEPAGLEETLPEPENLTIEVEQKAEEKVGITKIPLKEVEKKTLTDQFKSKSLNDLVVASKKLDQQLAGTPITKLESAIGLNDRFQYIRELFENDAQRFSETIKNLDRMHTLEEAVEHLGQQFNWEQNETSIQFMHLVKRRFSI